MLKIAAILTLIAIVSSVHRGCDSCGSECTSACGTRRFRSCCFNYLRKKRGPDAAKMFTLIQDLKLTQPRIKLPYYIKENVLVPEKWISNMLSNENFPYASEDTVENDLY